MDAYLTAAGYDKTFHAVFQDWVAANFLDENQGIYGYADLQVLVSESRVMHEFGELERDVAQYGTHYIEIAPKLHDQPLRFRFEGVSENRPAAHRGAPKPAVGGATPATPSPLPSAERLT